MKRGLAALGVAVAALALFGAIWTLRTASHGRPPTDSGLDVRGSAEPSPRRRRPRPPSTPPIGAREVDSTPPGRVRGVIVDPEGLPVEGGIVSLSCWGPAGEISPIEGGQIGLDEHGGFDGPGCDHRVCVRFEHPAWTGGEAWVTSAGGRVPRFEVQARPRLAGQVVGPDGDPVPAARVTFSRSASEDVSISVLPLSTRATITDDEGRFSVARLHPAPCGPCEEAMGICEVTADFETEVRIAVSVPELGPAYRDIDLDALPPGPIEIRVPASAAPIVGRLTAPDGGRYLRAFVLARSDERPHEQRRADVEDDGFALAGLGPGSYALRAIQDGVEIASSVGHRAGDRVELRGSVPVWTEDVVVEIRDAHGRVWPGVRVEGGPFRTTTDRQGRVTAKGALVGESTVRVQAPTQRAVLRSLRLPAEVPVVWTLPARS